MSRNNGRMSRERLAHTPRRPRLLYRDARKLTANFFILYTHPTMSPTEFKEQHQDDMDKVVTMGVLLEFTDSF